MTAGPAPVRLLLVGMMGAGKTSVGQAIARATGWPFLDNDAIVEQVTGLPTPQVLAERGEPGLREAESLALAEVVRRDPPLVAGAAGGVVTRPADVALLQTADVYVVYLRAREDTLAARVGSGEGRPWLSGDPAGAIRALFAGRAPLYEKVADLVVDVDDTTVAETVARILAALPR